MLKSFIYVAFGSVLVALGIDGFFVPYQFLDGGMIGIGLLFHYWFDFQPGLTMIVLSIPLYFYAYIYDRPLFYNSIHGLWLTSLLIDMLKGWNIFFTVGPMASALIGGSIVGIGIGLLLRANAATGGTDLFAQLLGKRTGINVGKVIFIIDAFVLLLGWPIVGLHAFLHSLLAVTTVGFFTTILTHDNDKQGFSFH